MYLRIIYLCICWIIKCFNRHWRTVQTWRIAGTLREVLCTFMIITHSILLRMRNVWGEVVEKIKTHILCSTITFFPRKSCSSWDNVEEFGRVGQTTDQNMARANFMLDTQGYKHTLTICNTYCSPTTTMVTRTHLIVKLYVHCLSCYCLQCYCISVPVT